MKSAIRRKQQQEDLKAKILDAARELFVKEGVESVSMRKIAQKIGYSATTLYIYFKDKESLLHALCDRDFGTLQESFKNIGRITDPIERLRKLGQAYIAFALEYPNHYRLLFMTPHDPRCVDDEYEIEHVNSDQGSYEFLRATVVEGLAAGVFRDEYDDADLISQVLWSSLHGVAALHLIMCKDDWIQWRPVESVAEAASEAMIRGLTRNKKAKKETGDG